MVWVSAPASIANLGPGFDIVAVALSGLRDRVMVEFSDRDEIVVLGESAENIPRRPEENAAYAAARAVLEMSGIQERLRIKLEKGVPLGVGLGSSGASSAAAAYAANILAGEPLTLEEVVKCAAEGERVACGAGHYDNVSASVMGGFTILLEEEGPKFLRIEPRLEIEFVIAVPIIKTPGRKTHAAREVLPEKIPLKLMVKQTASVARLIAAILRNDPKEFGKAVNGDHVVEPARASLIPGFRQVKEAALRRGALGCSICGAGPSIFAVAEPDLSRIIGEAMREAFKNVGVNCRLMILRPSKIGAVVEEA